ncbi:MAG: hypothetical protein E7279_04835 [Lachnospiraceae bacterium]|nr:hypothetical protein [Lachnospiraceae bacterium]
MKKRIVAIGLIAILLVSTLAGCSCSNSTTNNTTTTGYKCDFKNKDIAIPTGTKLTDNGLEVTDKADATVKNVLDIEKQLPAIITRAGDENDSAEVKYMKENAAKQVKYKNYDAIANYTSQLAHQVDSGFGMVADFGTSVYGMVRAYYTGDITAAISGITGMLGMFGIGGSGGVTNEQILSAIQDLSLQVQDLRLLTMAMSAQLDETTKQAYRNGLQPFDNAMIALDTDAEILQRMLVTGAKLLAEQGTPAPAEGASAEEEQAYTAKLIAFIQENESTNPDLKDFTKNMDDLKQNYVNVAGELGKAKDFSPLTAYDNYWNLYFNFESQGYSLRAAYRANAEFEIKRAYSLISLYYNIGTGNTAVTYQEYGQLLANALTAIEENGPGISPEAASRQESMYCYGLEKNVKSIEVVSPIPYWIICKIEKSDKSAAVANIPQEWDFDKTNVGERQLSQYLEKMHGRTPQQDLELAGLWKDDYLHGATKDTKGLAYNYKEKGYRVKADIITWDGELKKGEEIYYFEDADLDLMNAPKAPNTPGLFGEQPPEPDYPNFEEATMIFAD